MADEGVFAPWLASLAFLLATVFGLRYLTRAEDHQLPIRRWVRMIATMTGQSVMVTVRTAIPVTAFLGMIFGGCVLALPIAGVAAPSEPGTREHALVTVVIVAGTLMIAMTGLIVLVVARTGRPRFLVLAPCRDMDGQAVEAWSLTKDPRRRASD